MKEIMKKIAAVFTIVAMIGIGSYAFGARAETTSTVSNPSSTSPSTGTNPGSQTNVIVPQSTGVQAVPVPAGETLGSLIVMNGLFGDNGINAVSNSNDITNSSTDLAGLIAVNNLLTPYGYGGGYGGYMAAPAYGGYGYGAGDTLGGLIVLNGLFGTSGDISDSNNLNGMSASAQGLAGLLAVNNLTSPNMYGGGYGGYMAAPAYGGYAATPAYGGYGYGAGDTLGGLIALNGLFGTSSIIDGDDNSTMSTGSRDLAGLIAVQNTTVR